MNDKTIDYYNDHAAEFAKTTGGIVFTDIQNRFLSKLQPGDYILDFGCGSGRDAKYFLDKGFRIDAVDGSEKLCEIAGSVTGITVKRMLFSELAVSEKYDGIWACSSILHLPKGEMKDVFNRMITALKWGGIIYTSFKYGDFEGYRNGRYFTDFTEESFREFICGFRRISITEEWISADVRPGRGDEKWLNIILMKSATN